MSMQSMVSVVVGVAILGAGVWYFSSKDANGIPTSPSQTENVQSETEGAATFKDLMSRTGSWECSVSTSIQQAPSEGTVLISDGNIRGNFVSTIEAMGGMTVNSHVIQADGYIYTWTDRVAQGMKTPLPDTVSGQATVGLASMSEQVEYSCAPWDLDASVFVPPTTIEFMEFEASGPQPI